MKWDGYRAMLLKDGARTRLLSRNLAARVPHILAAAPRVTADAMILDGELVALDEQGGAVVPGAAASLGHRVLRI